MHPVGMGSNPTFPLNQVSHILRFFGKLLDEVNGFLGFCLGAGVRNTKLH